MSAAAASSSSSTIVPITFHMRRDDGEATQHTLHVNTRMFPDILQTTTPLQYLFSQINKASIEKLDVISSLFFQLKFDMENDSYSDKEIRQVNTALEFIQSRQRTLQITALYNQTSALLSALLNIDDLDVVAEQHQAASSKRQRTGSK